MQVDLDAVNVIVLIKKGVPRVPQVHTSAQQGTVQYWIVHFDITKNETVNSLY